MLYCLRQWKKKTPTTIKNPENAEPRGDNGKDGIRPLQSFHTVDLKYLRVKPQLMVWYISPSEAAFWLVPILPDATVGLGEKKRPTRLPPTGDFET